ncbi:hypothetical protein SAMN02745857_00939 [Andreprevotia lacus DSM 23236]|uniref:Uncharacterized protein n=1 Tax=Andreprevotia lacus DSM 23236 TaxID=1121001 RepID=A0A1W1X8V7_9NEIS|nr:hypothetical protein [Andreprevotia lacus]SMC20402.1 hypothetical protein SAMN02745857_00939 [Andreprevotia lacus DSM 23236]
MKIRILLLALCWLLAGTALAQSQPPLNANDWNFVLIPQLESQSGKGNNLSVTGLNHALRIGQQLNSLTAGRMNQVQQVYALTMAGDANNMATLESIEPYALLNNLGVSVQKLQPGDASAYNSPAWFAQQIVANQPRGTYILSMPADVLQQFVGSLSNSSVDLQGAHQYVVLSGRDQPFALSSYDDQTPDAKEYPLAPLRLRSACPQTPVEIHAKAPKDLRPYTAQSVYLVRHVEAHPSGNFENGNYVCQGQWRALGANARLLEKMRDRKPDYIFTSNPANIIGCSGTCSYIRPSLTVAPFAIQHDLPLTLAEFQWNDAADLAQSLFNRDSPYFRHAASGNSILVGWEHAHIEKAVKYLFTTIYQNPQAASQIPAWSFDDYDTVWELSTSKDGELTFKNTCEGIASASLPSTCPAFFQ